MKNTLTKRYPCQSSHHLEDTAGLIRGYPNNILFSMNYPYSSIWVATGTVIFPHLGLWALLSNLVICYRYSLFVVWLIFVLVAKQNLCSI